MSTDIVEPVTRMKAPARRELILEAATGVFGERGFHGTTTDMVARAAGVSQPYVVRMFGTKENLFLEVLERALERLLGAFRSAVEENRIAGVENSLQMDALTGCIGRAYVDLLSDRGLLLSLMHAFVMGSDPVIGPAARDGFLRVNSYLREELGFSAEATSQFLAGGMLINTMVGIRMADDYATEPGARELLDSLLPTKVDLLLKISNAG